MIKLNNFAYQYFFVFSIVTANYSAADNYLESAPALNLNNFNDTNKRAIEILTSHHTVISDNNINALSLNAAANSSVVIINQPGKYTIDKNLIFSPQNNNVTGILINTSNVTLDLKGYAIWQNNSSSNFSLISVTAGLSNINIINGTLANCTGVALMVNTGTKITINSLAINNCQATGLQLTKCNNSLITETYVTNCVINSNSNGGSGTELSGILLDSCTNIKITESASNNHINNLAGGTTNGFKLINCNNCTVSNCNSNAHQAAITNGLLIQNVKSCMFKNCKANNNLATQIIDTNGVAGFNLIYSINCHLDDCQAQANSSGNTAYGFKLLNSQYNKLNNCEASYNVTTCSTNCYHTYGFYCNTTNGSIGGNSIISCQATGNTGGANINSFGIGFTLDSGAKYTTISKCTADYNNSPVGTGCGIYLNGATYCNIRGNNVITNTGNSPDGGYGIYDTTTNSINLYMQNFAFGNGKTDNAVINNYKVFLAPDTNLALFPSVIAYLNNFNNLSTTQTANYNVEIIERP